MYFTFESVGRELFLDSDMVERETICHGTSLHA